MSDLIERLRGGVPATAQIFGGFTFDMQATVYLLSEAATALAEAEAEITRLRDALAPCAAILAQQRLPEGREYLIGGAFRVTVSEALDKANAALA